MARGAPVQHFLIILGILHTVVMSTITPTIEETKTTSYPISSSPSFNPPATISPTNSEQESTSKSTTSKPDMTSTVHQTKDSDYPEMSTASVKISISPLMDVESSNAVENLIDMTTTVENLITSGTAEGTTIKLTPSLTTEGSAINQTAGLSESQGGSTIQTASSQATLEITPPVGAAMSTSLLDGTSIQSLQLEGVMKSTTSLDGTTSLTHSTSIFPDSSSTISSSVLVPSTSTVHILVTSVTHVSSLASRTQSSMSLVQTPDLSTLLPPSSSDITSGVFYVSVAPTKTISNEGLVTSIKPTNVLDMVSVTTFPGTAETASATASTFIKPGSSTTTELLLDSISESSAMISEITPSLTMVSVETPPLSIQLEVSATVSPYVMDSSKIVIEPSSLAAADQSVDVTTVLQSSPNAHTYSLVVSPHTPDNIHTSMLDISMEESIGSSYEPITLLPSSSVYEAMTDIMTSEVLTTITGTIEMTMSTASTTNTPEFTTITEHVTTVKPLPKSYNLKAKLTLSGNCSVLHQMKADDNLADFNLKMKMALSDKLALDMNKIKIEDTQCGSLIVVVRLTNLSRNMVIEDQIMNMSTDSELFTSSSGNYTYGFVLISSEIMLKATMKPPTTMKPDKFKLTDVQIIVIIVCSIVGGMLLIYAFGFCIYACYQKKKTKSFDLGETPVCNLHMEDFTLTKMQRPQMTYTDYGPVVQQRGINGKIRKKNGHYQPMEDEMHCLAPDDIHQANTLPCRSSIELSLDTAIEPSSVHIEPQVVASGFDNPSFSSDDILDSGPDTDQELPLDQEPGESVGNNGYQPDDVVVRGNTNGHVRGEVATSF